MGPQQGRDVSRSGEYIQDRHSAVALRGALPRYTQSWQMHPIVIAAARAAGRSRSARVADALCDIGMAGTIVASDTTAITGRSTTRWDLRMESPSAPRP